MKLLATLAGSLLLIGGTAHAQLDPAQQAGSKIYSEPSKVQDAAAAARFSKAVAACSYFRLGRDAVDRLLRESDPVSLNVEGANLNWIRIERTMKSCMESRMDEYSSNVRLARVGMQFAPSRLRALMLEEAYLGSHEAPISIPEGATELTNRTYVSTGDDRNRAAGLGNYADCIVYRDAKGADALLRTEPASPEEDQAARALAPVLGGCLIEGQTIEFTPASIRAIAADGLWSRAAFGSKKAS